MSKIHLYTALDLTSVLPRPMTQRANRRHGFHSRGYGYATACAVLPPTDVVHTLQPSLGHPDASAAPGRLTRLYRGGALRFSILLRGSDVTGRGCSQWWKGPRDDSRRIEDSRVGELMSIKAGSGLLAWVCSTPRRVSQLSYQQALTRLSGSSDFWFLSSSAESNPLQKPWSICSQRPSSSSPRSPSPSPLPPRVVRAATARSRASTAARARTQRWVETFRSRDGTTLTSNRTLVVLCLVRRLGRHPDEPVRHSRVVAFGLFSVQLTGGYAASTVGSAVRKFMR